MNTFSNVFLFSFIPIILFAVLFWSDILKRKQFGKRPRILMLSILFFGLIGVTAAMIYFHPGLFPSSSSFMQFTVFTCLYSAVFFLADYSIHRQRLVRSFFILQFHTRLKRYFIFYAALLLISLSAIILFALRPSFNGSFVKSLSLLTPHQIQQMEQTGSLGSYEFYFFTTILFILFSLSIVLFLFTVNRSIFFFKTDVIRKNYLLMTCLNIITVFYILHFIFRGLASPPPLWIYVFANLCYIIRITNEYFYQRTRNLDRMLMKFEQSLKLKNDLITSVVNSPLEEDTVIIKTTVQREIERARALLPVPEHGVSGSLMYIRDGNRLKVNSTEHINGICIPLLRLDTLKLYKNKEQLDEIIVRTPFLIDHITSSPKESLSNWAEKIVKDVLETKKEIVIEAIPGEARGMIKLIAIYPVFDKETLMGLIVIFKDSFNRLFPEEENSLATLVENLHVILSIINGKHVQRERNRLQGELDIAKNIQTSILPKTIIIDGYECATNMVTASEVGGDVFDYFRSPFGTYLGIGDVSGHGLPAGITALIQLTAFQSVVRTADLFEKPLAPFEVYDLVNKILCEINRNRIGSDKFMTENYFLLNNGTFTFAGTHLIALQYRKQENQVVELPELANRTAFMGISEHISSKTSEGQFTLQVNDILLLYTDGIIEAKDGSSEQFGLQRLKTALLEHAAEPLADIISEIMRAVWEHAKSGDLKKYGNTLADDATLVIIKKL